MTSLIPVPGRISLTRYRRRSAARPNMRRFTRLTKGFSKKVQNHMHTFDLHFICCNFVKVQQQVIPAIAAGLTDRLWDNNDLSAIVAANEPVPKKRGPYKKRTS